MFDGQLKYFGSLCFLCDVGQLAELQPEAISVALVEPISFPLFVMKAGSGCFKLPFKTTEEEYDTRKTSYC